MSTSGVAYSSSAYKLADQPGKHTQRSSLGVQRFTEQKNERVFSFNASDKAPSWHHMPGNHGEATKAPAATRTGPADVTSTTLTLPSGPVMPPVATSVLQVNAPLVSSFTLARAAVTVDVPVASWQHPCQPRHRNVKRPRLYTGSYSNTASRTLRGRERERRTQEDEDNEEYDEVDEDDEDDEVEEDDENEEDEEGNRFASNNDQPAILSDDMNLYKFCRFFNPCFMRRNQEPIEVMRVNFLASFNTLHQRFNVAQMEVCALELGVYRGMGLTRGAARG